MIVEVLFAAALPSQDLKNLKPCELPFRQKAGHLDKTPCIMPRVTATSTRAKLDISAAGTVERCVVVTSSGNPKADEGTCAMLTKATFKPAVDPAGKPIPATTVVKVTFRIVG